MGLARLLPRPGNRDDISKGVTVGRVIAFANQKGGVAKTTTTLNLGVAFAEAGMSVLLVDLDPQGNLTMSQNLNPEVGIQGILPTMYDNRTLHSREAVEILQENFGDLVFGTRIRKTIRYAEAPVKGSSVLKYDPTGTAAEAYRELAKEVLNGSAPREHA